MFERVPQLELLKHVQLMITHGGLNSIKECVHLGVPMLVYPVNVAADQPGNAARVVAHGLGLRGQLGKDSDEEVRNKLLKILRDSRIHSNSAALGREVASWDAQEPFLRFMETKFPEMAPLTSCARTAAGSNHLPETA